MALRQPGNLATWNCLVPRVPGYPVAGLPGCLIATPLATRVRSVRLWRTGCSCRFKLTLRLELEEEPAALVRAALIGLTWPVARQRPRSGRGSARLFGSSPVSSRSLLQASR